MQLSIFDVLGPVMIGPSSSHTAGAARLARVAALIANKPFTKVSFGLSGSFAKTGRGHGTNKALLAGALGLAEDDERIKEADTFAKQCGVTATYHEEDLEWMHENAAHITFFHTDGTTSEVYGSSIGGGRIMVRRIGTFDTELTAENPTLLVRHTDRPGVVSEISRVLAQNGINIALMRLVREARGRGASMVIEVDGGIPAEVANQMRILPNVLEAVIIDVS